MPTYLSPGVYMEEVSSGSKPIEGVGTAVAAFVGFCEKGPVNEPTLVTNWTQYVATFGEFVEGSYLAHSVYGYFLNGGGAAYVVRIGANGEGDGDTSKPLTARAELPGADGSKAPFTATALETGAAGDDISVEVADASDPGEGGQNFKLTVRKGIQEEVYDNVSVRKGANNVVSKVKAESKLIALEEAKGGQLAAPARGQVKLGGGGAPLPATTSHVDPNDYVGSSADRTGFGGLEAVDEITMLCVPDLTNLRKTPTTGDNTATALEKQAAKQEAALQDSKDAIMKELSDVDKLLEQYQNKTTDKQDASKLLSGAGKANFSWMQETANEKLAVDFDEDMKKGTFGSRFFGHLTGPQQVDFSSMTPEQRAQWEKDNLKMLTERRHEKFNDYTDLVLEKVVREVFLESNGSIDLTDASRTEKLAHISAGYWSEIIDKVGKEMPLVDESLDPLYKLVPQEALERRRQMAGDTKAEDKPVTQPAPVPRADAQPSAPTEMSVAAPGCLSHPPNEYL